MTACSFLVVVAAAAALMAAGCGADASDSTTASVPTQPAPTATPDPRETLEAKLLESFSEPEYQTDIGFDAIVWGFEYAEINTRAEEREQDWDVRHTENVEHELSCVQQVASTYVCEHHMMGRVYFRDTQIKATFDPSNEGMVVESEVTDDGHDFPTDVRYGLTADSAEQGK